MLLRRKNLQHRQFIIRATSGENLMMISHHVIDDFISHVNLTPLRKKIVITTLSRKVKVFFLD